MVILLSSKMVSLFKNGKFSKDLQNFEQQDYELVIILYILLMHTSNPFGF
jgi:hypothetical protein